jgi:hypothetical protein
MLRLADLLSFIEIKTKDVNDKNKTSVKISFDDKDAGNFVFKIMSENLVRSYEL